MPSIAGHKARSSYASAALIKRLGKQQSTIEHMRIDMMMCSSNQKIYQYDVKISSIVGEFRMEHQLVR